MHRLRPRQIGRALNRKRTLPQKLMRELRWLWRDIQNIRDEFRRLSDPKLHRQSEMAEEDIARDGF
jgi:hypothetical protein